MESDEVQATIVCAYVWIEKGRRLTVCPECGKTVVLKRFPEGWGWHCHNRLIEASTDCPSSWHWELGTVEPEVIQ